MAQFEFPHLSHKSLERLQQMREELERTLELQHQIDRGEAASLKDYWRSSGKEKNILRYEVGLKQWRGESTC